MHLAVIRKTDNVVDNIVVPPEGHDIWQPSLEYYVVETELGRKDDHYKNGNFISPEGHVRSPEDLT